VALTGKQKAAMLLMSLDAVNAAELLKGMDAEVVEELAMELTSLDASGLCNAREQTKVVREFCNSLGEGQSHKVNIGRFLNEMLMSILGREKAEQIQDQIKKATAKKDMFIGIRSASVDELVLALDGEHPQTVAVVLSELDMKKSQEVMPLLNEDVRLKTVWRMTTPDMLGFGVKQRIASMISERLRSFKGETVVAKPGKQEENLRKLAIVLSGLEKDLRDQLLDEINKRDEEIGKTVRILMVTWEDILSIADRSLQEALRTVEPSKLAVALFGADEEIVQKIRSNISERAVTILDEEISLMQEPLEKEVLDAREEVVRPLREANEEGKLRMVGR
jgi:flagellar motor switch protein FliG